MLMKITIKSNDIKIAHDMRSEKNQVTNHDKFNPDFLTLQIKNTGFCLNNWIMNFPSFFSLHSKRNNITKFKH